MENIGNLRERILVAFKKLTYQRHGVLVDEILNASPSLPLHKVAEILWRHIPPAQALCD